jgi:nucleotide-binding universal stress UspA family protein
MFERILAVIDDSATAPYVIGESITVAREDGDELTFCVALDPALSADRIGPTSFADLATELSQRLLDDALRTAHAASVHAARGTILQGVTARAVVDFARTQKAGLILLGMAPRFALLRPFLRSLAEELLLETTIPLCVVRGPTRGTLNRRILVPIVDDDVSHMGVTYALRLGRDFRSKLIFLAIQDGPNDSAARHALDHAERDAAAAGVSAEGLLLPRDTGISNAIAHNAEVLSCDAIVMATHMRAGFPRLIEGSVTEAVAYCSDVPVVIVRGPLTVSNH